MSKLILSTFFLRIRVFFGKSFKKRLTISKSFHKDSLQNNIRAQCKRAPKANTNSKKNHQLAFGVLAFVSLIFLFNQTACRPTISSNFNIEQWVGYNFEHKPLTFRDLPVKGLILNFYSPICKPCIEELPALELLYQRTQQVQGLTMYLAVEASLSRNGLTEDDNNAAKLSPKQQALTRQKILQRLRLDISSYNIRIPILIMYPQFRIGARQVVQATPETLFFRTKPLRLQYNFIGPLATEKTQNTILSNSRFQFALRKLDELSAR